jgi:cephalosporin hydroxylase
METEILNLKPDYIFDVEGVNHSVFIEKDCSGHDYITCRNYYEIYYAIAKHYQPESILEIGVRYGYSLYSMMVASERLNYVRGYDNDNYNADSVERANANISAVISEKIDFKVENLDTQNIDKLDRFYDLIHIDGDHSYEGKVHDLNLIKGSCKILIVDDYNNFDSVKNATNDFVNQNEDIIKNKFLINSLRGSYIIEFNNA